MEVVAADSFVGLRNISESSVHIPVGLFAKLCAEVDTWFLMSNPWPVITIVIAYLVFVIKVGPDYMKDKKSFEIKPIIMTYNLYQILHNFFIVQQLFTTPGAINYLWNHACHPIDKDINEGYAVLNASAWYYFISKIMDLFDTVFFILRKKNSHVTFLHVYHHSNMVLTSWAYLKYIKGEQGVVVGWINALVHTIMYSYYFLSTLGPGVRKYLWWKKYITKLQMLQFIVIILYMSTVLIFDCEFPEVFTYYLMFQGVTFFILFVKFYIKAYIVQKLEPMQNGKAKKVK